jgi:hypothetical protein
MANHAASFDVAHLHACRNLPGVIAARHLRAAGVPLCSRPTGRRRGSSGGGWRSSPSTPSPVTAPAGATRVLAVTAAERQQLRELGALDQRDRRHPNPD